MKRILFSLLFLCVSIYSIGQADTAKGTFWKPNQPNYKVKYAIEVESLFPMFLTGGYHFAVGFRYKKFRLRASIINGGTYNAETAGIHNSSTDFKRYYTTSPGVFFGYNVWKNLDVYSYLEFHTFRITQRSSGQQKDLKSIDSGLGISYQIFIGRYFYIQPGLHLYLRRSNSVDFGEARYSIPNVDISPVIRVGVRLWKKRL